MKRNNNIVLIGMPGSGKSTIGSLVSQQLHAKFLDLDHYIETRENKKIPELFLLGEAYFRQIESNAVQEIYRNNFVVIATGGGIVTRPKNMALLRKTGIIFYIERPIQMILESLDITNRPLLVKNRNKIYTLYQERKHLYETYCHYCIINNESLEAATEQITTIMMNHQQKLCSHNGPTDANRQNQ
jgi:shikimate kinase